MKNADPLIPNRSPRYDPRYLAGIAYFNQQDYYEAHEVWEDLWRDTGPADRRFYQGLIQVAVAIYHWERGNVRGARRLLLSARAYMQPYFPHFQGLDLTRFWSTLDGCTTAILDPACTVAPAVDHARLPHLELDRDGTDPEGEPGRLDTSIDGHGYQPHE